MADETNQNDRVQDLLARLRMQMSQLDEMFGIDSQENGAADGETAPLADNASSAKEEDALTNTEKTSPFASEDEEHRPYEQEKVTQIDLFGDETFPDQETVAEQEPALPAAQVQTPAEASEEGKEDALSFEENADAGEAVDAEGEEEEPLVFSLRPNEGFFSKETVVAVEDLVSEEPTPLPVQVTEVKIPQEESADAREEEREIAQTHASFFLPNTTEEAQPSSATPSPLSPFSTERRFDPSRYDAMLAAYEKPKEEVSAQEDETVAQNTCDLSKEEEELPSVLYPVSPLFDTENVTEEAKTDEEVYPSEEKSDITAQEDLSEERDLLSVSEEPEESAEPLTVEAQEEVGDAEPEQEPTPSENGDALTANTAESQMEDAEKEVPVLEKAQTEESETLTPVQTEKDEEPDKENDSDAKEQVHPRVVRADTALSDTDTYTRRQISAGRVHLAPSGYRAKDKTVSERRGPVDDEEDYFSGLPEDIRESISNYPLGRPNRAQGDRKKRGEGEHKKKKNKFYFAEEVQKEYDEVGASDYMHHQMKEELKHTRIRQIVCAVFAFLLLLLENVAQLFSANEFIDTQTAGIVDAILIFGAALAAWPRLQAGAWGILKKRVLPESFLLVSTVAAFLYAVVFGFMEKPVPYFSFVPALGLCLLYTFRVLQCESRLKTFNTLVSAGEKLVLSPTKKEEMHAEMHAMGKSLDGEAPLLYRVRKAAFIDGFSRRSAAICEDEKLNFYLLIGTLCTALAAFLIALFTMRFDLTFASVAAMFALLLTTPLLSCAVHIYPLWRMTRAEGNDSAVVGEATVEEATAVEAVGFEDIEAAPSSGVTVSGVRVHCDDPTKVFKYLTALYAYIGGPLCGRFAEMYVSKSGADESLSVKLVEAKRDGISAVVDGAELVVGNAYHMLQNNISPIYDAADEAVLPEGKRNILYVSVNRMVCMKFYIEHSISASFEKNVMRLHKLGIATILRTYDPNFNDKTIATGSSLLDCRVHVVTKTAEQLNDFYTQHTDAGIVTAGTSGKLLRLLLLCFRTRRALRFGRIMKLLGAIFGGALALTVIAFGHYGAIPSVFIAFSQLMMLSIHLLFVRAFIKLPTISEGK